MSATRGDLKLVTHPDKHPAVDFITRSGEGPFVDTGVDIILRARPGMPVITERLYLSVSTIGHLAQVAGLSLGGLQEQENRTSYEAGLIAQGKLDGLKEGLGDGLVDVARTLREWLDAAAGGTARRTRS